MRLVVNDSQDAFYKEALAFTFKDSTLSIGGITYGDKYNLLFANR